eukprot:TRINITY_DN5599_c0_g1_i3.p2 TRINITY_DN5599_c0_g1~~TRINITY_DN5599_c0_g1_i3.p2  ORF type:complete len:120 (+),score=20.56 TRINITY_DN5599_c0_g1_i3:501-860(+)
MSVAPGEEGVTYTYELIDFATGHRAPLTELHRPAMLASQRRVLGVRAHRDALDTLAGLRAFFRAQRAAPDGLWCRGERRGADVILALFRASHTVASGTPTPREEGVVMVVDEAEAEAKV